MYAIRCEGISKKYSVGGGFHRGLLIETLWNRVGTRERSPSHWALRNVSLEIREGEVLGLIGRNGAGKSTLLKVLSGITTPTAGTATIRGRVGSLLEVGTGFHIELTGRENVFFNGAVLGMGRREIESKFDEIVAFSGVDEYIDTAVKYYSSGMKVRLAFAVAAHLEPEVLLVDEVLAVGDAEFQRRCLGKMRDVTRSGRTVVFVSHNMASIRALCTRAALIDDGELVALDDVSTVLNDYLADVGGAGTTGAADLSDLKRSGEGPVRFRELRTVGSGGPGTPLVLGEPGSLELAYESPEPIGDIGLVISIRLNDSLGDPAALFSTELTGTKLEGPAHGTFVCHLDPVPLLPGRYWVTMHARSRSGLNDWLEEAAEIEVVDGDFFGTGRSVPNRYGHVAVPHEWHMATPRNNGGTGATAK